MVLEKTLESPLDSKEGKPVNPKGNQPWIFIGRTDAEAEAPLLWPPDPKNWLIGKDPDAGTDWRQEEKGTTEDKMDMSLGKLREIVKDRDAWRAAVHGVPKSRAWLNDWTELKLFYLTQKKMYWNLPIRLLLLLMFALNFVAMLIDAYSFRIISASRIYPLVIRKSSPL